MENQTNPIDQYTDFLMKEAKLNTLPDEFKFTYQRALNEQVVRRVGLLMIKELPEQKAEEFSNKFLSTRTPDTQVMQSFLTIHIKDFEKKMKAGLDEFAREFLLAIKMQEK